jgi:hypothetical protein
MGEPLVELFSRAGAQSHERTVGPIRRPDSPRRAETEARQAFLGLRLPVLRGDEETGTSLVVPAREDVELAQVPLASSGLLEENEYIAACALLESTGPVAYRLSCTDASTHQLPGPGVPARQCTGPLSLVGQAEADRDRDFRIEDEAFVQERCHSSTSAKRSRDQSLPGKRLPFASSLARAGLPLADSEPDAPLVLPD